MKAHILGFWWRLTASTSLEDLFKHLSAIEPQKYAGYERLLFAGETEKYHTGLFLTAKSHKKFCELKKQRQGLTINVRKAEAGSSLIDFNFFVLHKKTARGLYQYYHNSCHPKMFSRYCARQYGNLQNELADAEIEARGDKITGAQRTLILEKYQAPLEWEMLVRPENFDALVRQFQKIASFQFNLASVKAETEQRFRGFQGISKRITHRITFQRDVSLKERARAIIDLVGADTELEEAAVHGQDSDGLDKTIALHDNPDSFGSYDFDNLAENMDFKPEDFAKSVFMRELIKVADSHSHLLGATAK